MYRNIKISIVVPCYNEEKLLERTIKGLPGSIDYIILVNDASTDSTIDVMKKIAKKNKKVRIIDSKQNGGVGNSLKKGFRYSMSQTDAHIIGITSGDAQCDPSHIEPMLDELIERNCDYVKGNRFFFRNALKSMPPHRRVGNIFISLLTKFSTGYYSISDTTMGFGFLKKSVLEKVDFDIVGDRYDYETSMLVALSIAHARIKDHAVPAIYGEETSTINFLPTVARVMRVVWVGFWRRMYYKYTLFSFHPIVIFLFGGLILSTAGWLYAIILLINRIVSEAIPSTGTVMLAVLPIILGFQMLMTAMLMDMHEEDRP